MKVPALAAAEEEGLLLLHAVCKLQLTTTTLEDSRLYYYTSEYLPGLEISWGFPEKSRLLVSRRSLLSTYLFDRVNMLFRTSSY